MQRTRVSTLAVLTVLVGAIVWVVVDGLQGRGSLAPIVPLLAVLVPLSLTVALLWAGTRVRRYTSGRSTTLTALGAARVVVFAKAASHGGAGFLGAYLALLVTHLAGPPSTLATEQAWVTGVTAAAFAALVGAGLLVEHWCHVDPPEEDGALPGGAPSDRAPA